MIIFDVVSAVVKLCGLCDIEFLGMDMEQIPRPEVTGFAETVPEALLASIRGQAKKL